MNKNTTYIPVLNTLRGIAALLVVLFHFIVTTTGYITNETIRAIFHHGELGVTIFFVISGIVIPLSMISKKYITSDLYFFLKKRIIRVEIPFLASMILSILYLIARDYMPISGSSSLVPNLETILFNMFYLVPFTEGIKWINPVYWTLAIEFQYYLFLSIFLPFLMQKNLSYRVAFYVIVFLVAFLLPIQLFLWLPVFMVGISYVLYINLYINKTEHIIIFSISTLMIYVYQNFDIALTSIITLLVVHFFTNYSSKIGNFFGNISYSLYLLHTITGGVFINFMSHHFTHSYEKLIVISGGIILSILSAYIFYKYIEHPSKLLSTKVKYIHKKEK